MTAPDFSRPLALASLAAPAAPETIAVISGPVGRSAVTTPIAPEPTPQDTHLFLDPADPERRFWLPRYRIAEERVSGQDRYRIAFAEEGDVWMLRLWLEAGPAPGMEGDAARFPMLEHELEVSLAYTLQGGGVSRRMLAFQEVQRAEAGVEARLSFSGLPQRDEVFAALQDGARAPSLTVRRRIRVAVPTAPAGGAEAGTVTLVGTLTPARVGTLVATNPAVTTRVIRDHRIRPGPGGIVVRPFPVPREPALPKPELQYLGPRRLMLRGLALVRHVFAVANWQAYDKALFAPAPDLPPCGQNANAARTWVDLLDGATGAQIFNHCAFTGPENLQGISHSFGRDGAPPAKVALRMTDRKTGRRVTSDPIPLRRPPPPEPQFMLVEAAMEEVVEPAVFAFSRMLHGYIFAALDQGGAGPGPASPGGGALIRHRESFGGAVHSYFQDAADRRVFFHLPDDFRISRRGGAFRPPFMTLRVRSNGGSTQNTDVTWDFAITPHTDPARLAAARTRLAAATGQPAEALELLAYVTAEVSFTLHRPTATGRIAETRPGSALMLQGPVFDTLAVPVVEFQLAYDAMLGRTASALAGQVEIGIDGWETETRPFLADFTRLAGPVLDITTQTDGASQTVRLANAIESPLGLDGLALLAEGAGGTATIPLAASVGQGMQLAPGEALELSVPLSGLPGGAPATFALSGRPAVLADDAAILDAILDRTTLDYFREIEIHAIPALFSPPAGRPQDQVHAILVEFEGGATAVLTAETPKVTARVDYPFDEVILRRAAPDGSYRYTKTVIRVDGRQERDPAPLANTTGILFLSVFP